MNLKQLNLPTQGPSVEKHITLTSDLRQKG